MGKDNNEGGGVIMADRLVRQSFFTYNWLKNHDDNDDNTGFPGHPGSDARYQKGDPLSGTGLRGVSAGQPAAAPGTAH